MFKYVARLSRRYNVIDRETQSFTLLRTISASFLTYEAALPNTVVAFFP